jgi:heptosyltransferase III
MKILIFRAGALGDTLMLMPSIKALRGEHEIIIAGRSPGIEYLNPYVNECIDVERGGWHKLYNPGAFFETPSFSPDHVIGFLNDPENILLDNLIHLFPDSINMIFAPFPEPGIETHVGLYMANAIQSTGIQIDPNTAFKEAFIKPMMGAIAGGNRIVLHPGSGSIKKNYPPEFWLELIRGIKEKTTSETFDITILIGPAEQDIINVFENNAKVYVSQDRESLLSILDNTCLYIGHDSGVTHVAAMMGINTIALFRGSSIKTWQPIGPKVKIVEEKGSLKAALDETAIIAIDVIRQMEGMYI